jgi:hypothetical protein
MGKPRGILIDDYEIMAIPSTFSKDLEEIATTELKTDYFILFVFDEYLRQLVIGYNYWS